MDIAGKGKANPNSFYNAINQARLIFLKRREFKT
jgi:4-hydroxy-L-threonine phosphate dehydrogenase PdxA